MTNHDRGEEGFTLVEVMIGSVVALVLLSMVSLSTITMTKNSVGSIQSGSSTGPAFLDAQEVQQVLSGAWTQTNTSAAADGITPDCTEDSMGTPFDGTSPFVPLDSQEAITGTDMMFCALLAGSSTSYTYEVHFTNCNSGGFCTLAVEREPSPNCGSSCGGEMENVRSMTGVSEGTAGDPPFTYYDSSGSSFIPTASTLDEIEAVQVNLDVANPAEGGDSSLTVQRMILLPNTLGGGS